MTFAAVKAAVAHTIAAISSLKNFNITRSLGE
jgi:hypothetical protein